MIEYLIANNPDQRIIDKAAAALNRGELVILPTDTSWVLAGDPFHKNAVEQMYKIKGEDKSHHFSLLCRDISMANEIALIPDDVFRLMKRAVPGHYTFIFSATKKIIRALKASKTDHQVGVRFVPDTVIERLLEATNTPLITTNITHNMLELSDDDDDDVYSYLIDEKFANSVALILDPGEYEFVGVSTIYDFVDNNRECIREGAGALLF